MAVLCDAVIRAQSVPDVIPLVVALLDRAAGRAAELAADPPKRRPPITTT